MLFILNAPRTEPVTRAPAYDGNIIGVYSSTGDVVAAHGMSRAEGRSIIIVPESGDTYDAGWDAEVALAAADISVRVDPVQNELIEARGFLACVAAGELDNAPTE
ncbi:MAG: hypothetical protein GY937_22915 [bacterium]|nr:hypothetical protein [bacterium]